MQGAAPEAHPIASNMSNFAKVISTFQGKLCGRVLDEPVNKKLRETGCSRGVAKGDC